MTTDEHRDIAGNRQPGLTVGAEFKLLREERRQSVRDVADVVRIQTRYLEALEDNRIEHLPGRVYALGFVRTYAEYLGLDPNDMVERFKQEAQGLESQSDLSMPEPIDEGKVPTAAIVIVAVLLAAAAYSAWYFMSGPETRIADIVPEVPERLAGLAPEPLPAEAPDLSAPAVAEPAGTAEGAEETTPLPPSEPEAVEAPEPVAVAPVEPAPEPPAPAPTPAVETPAPTPAPEPEPAPPAPSAEAVAPTPAPAPAPVINRDPVVYGAGNTGARVVITALEDAWVEVAAEDGAILFSRVLRKGDSYRAPDRPGATFVTGNAGGLAIEVDGTPAPALGPAGVVRKNVRLDPDLLKAGQAVP